MGSSGGQKRIQKVRTCTCDHFDELAECYTDPPTGMRIELADQSSIYKWVIHVTGPSQSAYEGGHFTLLLTLPTDYPFKPPILTFQTKIYHPNVSNDDKGSMCLGMLRSDAWKPPNKIRAVLDNLRNIMIEPNVDDAVETAIAEQYKSHRKEFEKTAREWTKRYAV